MICLRKDGIRWEVTPGFEHALAAVLAAEGSVVKQSPVKLVTSCSHDGKTFYLKRYRHHVVPWRGLKFLFKPSQARREWNTAHALEPLGIPSVRHLALGERWGARGLEESILITEGFAGQSLDTVAAPDPQVVLQFVKRMHERGVLQRDLHAGNLLVGANGELRLVDLHGIVIKPRLTEAEREHNLATLTLSVALPVSPAVRALAVRLRRELYAYRSKRCLKHNRDFAPLKFGGLRWHVRLQLATPAVKAILNDPDAHLAGEMKILKAGRCATVGVRDGLVLKRHNFRDLANLAKDSFRPSRAERAFRKAYHLELVGIPTARPIAAANQRVGGLPWHSYFLMEEIPNVVELPDWKGDLRRVVRDMAELVARLHNEGFRHRDLKATNILVGPAGQLYLIDLEGLRYMKTVPRARVLFDLGRLARGVAALPYASRSHRVAFLRAYCKARGLRAREFFGVAD